MVTMGNFFSGSGTWELAAQICGAEPLWESEIEKFPIKLEAKRFPNCKQLGDITQVSGYEIEPVDIMTNSSPCQDLSVAGARKGLEDGKRSGLFHQVIRITKEMRLKEYERYRTSGRTDVNFRPRPYVWCWENVPGLLSSGKNYKGEDFRNAIEEIAKIVEPDVHIPMPERWTNAGYVEGNGWNLSWAVRDAANEGVPQRRRRVFLVASFRDDIDSKKILFESEGMCWDFKEIRETWERTSESLEERIAQAGRIVRADVQAADGVREQIEKNSQALLL